MTQKESDFLLDSWIQSLNTICHSGYSNKLIKKLIQVTMQEMRMTVVLVFTILLLCCGINGTFLINEKDADLKDKTHLSGNILQFPYVRM